MYGVSRFSVRAVWSEDLPVGPGEWGGGGAARQQEVPQPALDPGVPHGQDRGHLPRDGAQLQHPRRHALLPHLPV